MSLNSLLVEESSLSPLERAQLVARAISGRVELWTYRFISPNGGGIWNRIREGQDRRVLARGRLDP